MSAFGFLGAVPSVDAVRGYACALDGVDWGRVAGLYKDMESQARSVLGDHDVELSRMADMRYLGQGFEVSVPLPAGELSAADADAIRAAFARTYAARYGRVIEDGTPELVSWRLSVRHRTAPPALSYRPQASGTAPGTRRAVRLPGLGDVVADVHDRAALAPGTVIPGPAVFEERETSCAVGPDCVVRVAADYSLVIDIDTDTDIDTAPDNEPGDRP
jgi:N-methylhydantoinase A